LGFLDPSLSTIHISPPVFFLWVALPHGSHIDDFPALKSTKVISLLELDTAAYAMAAKTICTLFYSPNMPDALDPTLCRLYFGKVIKELGPGGRPNHFFNSKLPLDVSRYRKLLEVAVEGDCVYPSVEDIVYGMG